MKRLPIGPCHTPLSNCIWIGRDNRNKPFISRRDQMNEQTGMMMMMSSAHDIVWLEDDWFPDVPPKTIIKISCEKFLHLGLQDLAHLNFLTIGNKND